MVFVVQLDQRDPQQRPAFEIKRGLCLIFTDLLRTQLTLRGWQVAKIDDVQVNLCGLVDPLQGVLVTLIKAGTQGFMALDQVREAAAQRGFIQLTAQAQRAGDGEGAAVRGQLPQKPQAVLRQRLWQFVLPVQVRDIALGQPAVLLQCADLRDEGAEGRRFKQQTQIKFKLEFFPQAGDHLGGHNRVAAQQEKMVIGGHLLDVQMLAPNPGDQRFQITGAMLRSGQRVRWLRGRKLRISVETAIGQPAAAGRALQLAAGGLGQRTGVEQHDHARRLLASVGHGLTNGSDQRVSGQDFLHAAADFRSDTNALLTFDIDRKRRDTTFTHDVNFALNDFFNVLGVQVLAANDHKVFQASGDEQLAVTHKAQIAGA